MIVAHDVTDLEPFISLVFDPEKVEVVAQRQYKARLCDVSRLPHLLCYSDLGRGSVEGRGPPPKISGHHEVKNVTVQRHFAERLATLL